MEASAYTDSCVLQVQYTDYLGVTKYITRTVGPFNLTFKTVTFAGGSIKNIPCYATTPVTVALDNYLNTDNNYPFDKNEWITRHFEWTLPSGWQTTAGQTGTFVGLSLIVVIPPVSNSSVNISVRAKANNQYSQPSTLQITRNLEDFSIGGDAAVTCYSTKHVIYTYYLTKSFMYLHHYKIQTLKEQMRLNKLHKITPKATKISPFHINATFLSVTSSESKINES